LRTRPPFRVVAFDLDGTLINEKSSWIKIHRHFGTASEASRNLILYEKGQIDYREFMRRDVGLWPKRLHISEIAHILLRDLAINSHAPRVISELKWKGYKVAIVSAGLDILTERVGSTLEVDIALANGLETDDEGYLTGNGIVRVELSRKEQALNGLLMQMDLTLKECVCVGDSKYDSTFLQNAGLGVAVNGDNDLAKIASLVIKELPELLKFV